MKNKYLTVKKYIDEYDYYSLLKQGAPENEFASEAYKISELISEESSVEQISETIAKVMHLAFGNDEIAEKYLDIARKINAEL